MNDAGLNDLLRQLDPELVVQGPVRQITVEGTVLLVVSDARADRMRIMTPLRPVKGIEPEQFVRMLQANFDAVLDARYAIAQEQVWSVFIHPLSPLTEDQLVSGLVQVVVAARTFGTSYTSGALVFGGGDSGGLHKKLYDKLIEQKRKSI